MLKLNRCSLMAALAGAAAVVPGAALAAEATRPDLSDELRSARSGLPVKAGHLSPEIAARVQAWREAPEIYYAAEDRRPEDRRGGNGWRKQWRSRGSRTK